MTVTDQKTLTQELMAAHSSGQVMTVPPSARDQGFDLTAAYAIEAELAELRRASGHTTVGRKVGFANEALWRVLKLDTLVWAHMYDDTVRHAGNGVASLSIEHMYAPKIEPEIVFRLKKPLGAEGRDPAAVLEAVDWLALGFEIVDCVFPDWKFTPADFVAAFGFHVALVVGEPRLVQPEMIPALVDQLPAFKVKLMKDQQLVEEGSGKNSLRSPALCLDELASAISRQPAAEPLAAGELVSSGSLTAAHPIASGETWTAVVDGLDLSALTLRIQGRFSLTKAG
jgi:2-oxo-3-hexenedioate decarboxylase